MAEISDRDFHSLDPAARQFVFATVIEGRGHLAFKQVVKGLGFDLILVIGAVVNFDPSDRPSDEIESGRVGERASGEMASAL
jgi:hypothetical protein